MKLNIIILFILILLYLPLTHAHLDGGEDKIIGNYLIDFGFSPEQPKATEPVILAFNLLNDTTKEIIEPTSAWVRISSSNDIVFAGTFHSQAEHIAFTYTFPEAEEYEILVRFKDNENTLVETSFQLDIGDSTSKKGSSALWIKGAVLILLIFLFYKFLIKKRQNFLNKNLQF